MSVWPRLLLALWLCLFVLIGCDSSDQAHDFDIVVPEVERSAETYIKAAHWFGNGWPVNFWNTDLEAVALADFEKIKSDGFNTIIFLVPWPGFAPDPTSGNLDQERLSRLRNLMSLAHESGLMSVLRVSYAWDAMDKTSGSRLRSLWLEDESYEGWLGYLDSLWMAVADVPGFQFGFFSWEDLWAIVSVADADFEERLAVSERLGFDVWVRSRYSENELSQWYGVSQDQVMPIPNRREKSFALFLEYMNEAWIERYFLPAQERFPRLSMEIRIDSDPIFDGDTLTDWFHHKKAWNLPGAQWVTLYWSPAMGGQNVGEQLTPEEAASRLDYWLQRVAEHAGPKKIFIGQFLAEDFTPGYEMNGKLPRDEVGEFLDLATPILNARTSGVGLWTWRDYAHDAVPNPQFFEGLDRWSVTSASTLDEEGVLLSPNGALKFSAQLYDYHAPGGPARANICIRGKSVAESIAGITVYQGHGDAQVKLGNLVYSPIATSQCVEHDTNVLSFELAADSPLVIQEINAIGFVQISGMRSLDGGLKPVASAYRRLNEQLALQPKVSNPRYSDAWMGKFWVEELLVPVTAGVLLLKTHLPDEWPVVPRLRVALNGQIQGTFPCVAQGQHVIDISQFEVRNGVAELYVEADHTYSPAGDERQLGCVTDVEWLPASPGSPAP